MLERLSFSRYVAAERPRRLVSNGPFSFQIMAAGMDAAVSKPFSTPDLMKKMWYLVNARQAGDAQPGAQ
jgi:hypothetical protein